MKTHARVVVIGGGVVGCSVLYHLAKLGWTDVILLERKELTAGSSWHAAGGFHAINGDPNIARLQAYTISLYKEIQQASGQDVGLHFTGGLNMAATRDRWELLRAEHARHRVLGLKSELVGPEQIRAMCPLVDVGEILGALFDPNEGHLDPYGATHAYAKAARSLGAEVQRHTRVTELRPRRTGGWDVVTDQGTIVAEHVVNAAGLWARDVGLMAGVELPVVSMEHHYLLTEDLPELKAMSGEIPLVLDLDGEIYLRQERKGVLLGVYEKAATPWALDGAPWDYGQDQLLPPNLERLTDSLDKGFRRFPTLQNAGIRRIVNGPFTFSPDGNPLVGPVPGLRNYWAACAVMAGFAQGGGVGLALAQWMIQGEPEGDIFAMDVARYGPYATRPYAVARVREFYARRFQIAYPNEYWPAGRPCRTTTVHEALREAGGVFGVSYGLEMPLYFAAAGEAAIEKPSLLRSNAFPRVREECLAARAAVGILDCSSFAKYRITGPRAAAALDRLLAARLPEIGRVRLTPMLGHAGRLMGDLTMLRLAADEFLIGGSGYLQAWHLRWFAEHLAGEGVTVANATDELGGIAIFGPRARTLLARVADADVGDAALPFMGVRRMAVGLAPAIVARLSVTGELGYEIYVPALQLPALLAAIRVAARDLDGRLVGMYAVNALRLEKSYGIWSREYSRDYTPRMARLERFLAWDKPDFIGRQAALLDRAAALRHRLVTFAVQSDDADALGYEPIFRGDEYVGYVTSGGYAHCAGTSVAMGYLDAQVPDAQDGLTITVMGRPRPARVLAEPLIDPSGSRMREA
ncbi:MAG: FAD-dependent oxidoreductase [Steroidobacteraceae bacterium]